MKIAVEKNTNLVLYYGKLWFTELGLRGNTFIDTRQTEETCTLIDLVYREPYQYEITNDAGETETIDVPEYVPPTLPENFIEGGYTFENNTFVINQTGIDYLNKVNQEKLELLQAEIVNQTQLRLDDFAKTREYDSIMSACTYATSAVAKFAAEGQYCVAARDATWNKLYEVLAEVEAGTRPVPTSYADVEPELPALEWPN